MKRAAVELIAWLQEATKSLLAKGLRQFLVVSDLGVSVSAAYAQYLQCQAEPNLLTRYNGKVQSSQC